MSISNNDYIYAYLNPSTKAVTKYSINPELIPETSLLRILHDSPSTINGVTHVDDSDIEYIIWYLKNRPPVVDPEYIQVFEYWGVYISYDIMHANEVYMRSNMYNPEFREDEMNTNQYYQLYNLVNFHDEYNTLTDGYVKPEGIITKKYITPRLTETTGFLISPHDLVVERLQSLDFMFELAENNHVRVLIAGEHVFKILTNQGISSEAPQSSVPDFYTNVTEIDLFILESEPQSIADYINAIGNTIEDMYKSYKEVDTHDDIIQSSDLYDAFMTRQTYEEDLDTDYEYYNLFFDQDKIKPPGSAWVRCSRQT